MDAIDRPFRPLVVGAPRSGFALLCSVVIHFLRGRDPGRDLRQRVLNVLLRGMGDHVASRIVERFATHGIAPDLLYNPNFRYLVGGPKWIARDRPDAACFRKYIGVRGMGDFTLVTRHPREVLNLDEVVHSHTDPTLWLEHPGYAGYTKFASIRTPIDILNSSVFSLNALASEYIQKFVPPENDNDEIRQRLARYKFTDMAFFEGLVKFLKGYFDEFMPVRDQYIVMRWEDLIDRPIETIVELGRRAGMGVSRDEAMNIWRKLDHVNLTQAHKHNFRKGHGIVGGWKNWITNRHLDMLRDYGFERHTVALDYGPIERLDESAYTPFQREVSAAISSGTVLDETADRDLFTFAFNKSNITSDKFPFRRYGWRTHTQVERSIFSDEALQNDIWDCAECACDELNAFIGAYLSGSLDDGPTPELLDTLQVAHSDALGTHDRERYGAAFHSARRCLAEAGIGGRPAAPSASPVTPTSLGAVATAGFVEQPEPPRLIATEHACNVVEFRNRYYALPHALGPTDLASQSVEGLPGVFVGPDRAQALEYARAYRP